MLLCVLYGHIIDIVVSVGIKYSSAGLGHEEAFPASCIANSTPQLKSAPREILSGVQYSVYPGFLQEM